ncbi:hypothetical protein [Planomicrobium sp. CPCC 101110]|uniref:hypothetical protein n=1 Tax=Planomicrobium sp. CPCC 101110 TaxID=2599619 RepID=UPI0011B40754|nr:hypothetical protein [Planomicrobium sp. CPCC 101110]TWT25272.1 hypothetical protein FQV30_12980 [Planomicrobium sp. CPCC 101110]
MLMLISSLLLVVCTLFFYWNGQKVKAHVNAAMGKCVAMSYGMVSSTAIGLIITFLLPGDLAVSTVLSVCISFLFAFGIGRLFGSTGIIEASAASFMGAMMGAMLAAMVPPARELFIVVSMDLFYVFVVFGLLYMMGREAEKTANVKIQLRLLPLAMLLLSTVSAAGIGTAVAADANGNEESGHQSHVHPQ